MNDLNTHRMRISIDLSSIKDHSFKGLIYAKYAHCQYIGIKQQFRTTPSIEVLKPVVEVQFPNSFASYIFESSKENLLDIFENLTLDVEIYHQDRLKKDQLIGIAKAKLTELLKSPIRKTAQSYVRVMDSYQPIDEINEEDHTAIKRVGLIRCIFYLEDLGPTDQLQQQEQKASDQISQDPGLPVLKYQSDDPEKQKLIMELNSLEHKVIWELDTWRKNEEARFKVQLRQTEYEMTQTLYSQFKMKEIEREKQFKQYLTKIQLNEQKIRQKAQELQKRESKIIQLEEESKSKLLETAKIIKTKDEEMGVLIKRQKDEKLNSEKEKTLLNLKLGDAQGQISKLEEELKSMKKEMEKSPMNIVKITVQEKNIEIAELKKELERINTIKDQYKIYYEKMRDELIKLQKSDQDNIKSQQFSTQQELERLKIELTQLKMNTNIPSQQTNQHIQSYSQQQQQQQLLEDSNHKVNANQNVINNPFKNALIKENENEVSSFKQKAKQSKNQKQYPQQSDQMSDFQRLLQEKEYLLESGEYSEQDPFIIEINRQIQELGGL